MRKRPDFQHAARAAEALGVTAKTLRVWERTGLIAPGRNAAGWRLYGPEELARIHQVLALKGLGLGLAEIGLLLKGRHADLDAVLALQAQALERRKLDVEKSLSLIAAARRRLKAGEAFAPDDFVNLIRETTLTEKLTVQELGDIFRPHVEKHFTPEEIETLAEREREGSFDGTEVSKTWDALFVEARALMAAGDPFTAAATDFARRWNILAAQFHRGDPVLAAKAKAVWEDALGDPGKASRLSATPEMFAFVKAATEAGQPRRTR